METKGLKMVCNVETRWISMRSPTQHIMAEYKSLLVKMGVDMAAGGQKGQFPVATNFNYLSDIEVKMLSLAGFILLLNIVHCLIKLSQSRDIFICDFLQSIKGCQVDLAKMFVDDSTTFLTTMFMRYQDLVSLTCSEIPMEWRLVEGDAKPYLVLNFGVTEVFAHCHCKVTSGRTSFCHGGHFPVHARQHTMAVCR